MVRPSSSVRAELYISTPRAKSYFRLLQQQRAEIERDLGYELIWDELPEGRDCRIHVGLKSTDPEDERDWPRQHEWLAAKLNQFHKIFFSRVRGLSAADDQDAEGGAA